MPRPWNGQHLTASCSQTRRQRNGRRKCDPLDFAVIGFRGNKFNGEIAPEILSPGDEGLIDIVDIVFISKDKDGHYTLFELNDLSPEEYAQFAPLGEHKQSLLTDEDVATLAESVPADCSALVLLWRNIWTESLGAR